MKSGDSAAAWLGGSEQGRVARDVDWPSSPLGPIEQWPESLCSAIRIALRSHLPMCVAWGSELSVVHNDAFGSSLGDENRPAFGHPAREAFADCWKVVEPHFERALHGEANGDLTIERSGPRGECHFDCSFSPIFDAEDTIGGVLATFSDATARVVNERRARTLRVLCLRSAAPEAVGDVWRALCSALAENSRDLSFVLLYELDPVTGDLTLAAKSPVAFDRALAPLRATLASSPWPFAELVERGGSILVEHPSEGREPAQRALAQALCRPGCTRPYGFLVTGIGPRCRLDESTTEFLRAIAAQASTALSHARPYAGQDRAALYELFMQAPAPICVLRGPELIFEMANPSLLRMIGRSDVLGHPLLVAVPELAAQDLPARLHDVLRTGVSYAVRETLVRLGGAKRAVEERHFTFVFSALGPPDVHADRVMVFASEATDQVRARAHLEDARRRAEDASRAKDEFMAMLGHELRNPLAPITTALELMEQDRSRVFERERTIIGHQVQHLTRLVDDLLDVSRITRGKIHLRTRPVELGEAIARAIELASPALEERRHRLRVEVPAHGLLVLADEMRLAQVVSNLLTNAAKYTHPGGDIAIVASAEERSVTLRVTDNGIGIGAELLPRIFDLFVQGERPQAGAGGLGLGLTLVRSLTELHGGSVAARSPGLGYGSEFELKLPRLTAPLAAATREERKSAPPPRTSTSAPRRVIIVDDNEDAAELLAEGLRRCGHEVRVAFEGPRGIDLARAFKPHVALLDLGLPVMDGYELARRLHELPEAQTTQLIAVTGYGQDNDRRRSNEAGFAKHLVKPVDLASVDQHIRQLVPDEAVAR